MSEADRERWDRRWSDHDEVALPAQRIERLAQYLPKDGVALDVAGGAGRHGVWLAKHGLRATTADVSPVALSRAEMGATAAGVTLHTLCYDMDVGCPQGPWDVVLVHHFLDRELLPKIYEELVGGGLLLMVHPTVTNLERNPRPSKRFLLAEGELRTLLSGWEVVHYEEGWGREGRHEAVVVARR